MSIFDLLRQEYVKGKVVGKYKLDNGNIGLVVEQQGTNRRYHVAFRDDHRGPSVENLFGLVYDPFHRKTDSLDRLIKAGDSVEMTLSYSRGPFREAYRLHSVSSSNPANSPYRPAKTTHY